MPTTTITREEALIRERMDTLARALRAKDTDALMAHYAPDVMTFDLMPLLCLGAAAYRKNFEAWFAAVQGPIDYEVRDLRITVGDEMAFCHSLSHVKSTRKSGERTDYWVRVTAGLRKMNGRWLITHEHVSLPFRSAEAMHAALSA